MNDSTKSPEEIRAEQWRIHTSNQKQIRACPRWMELTEAYRTVLQNKHPPAPHPRDATILHISYVRPSHEERQAANASLRRLFRELKGDYRPDEEPNPNRFRLDADF